jgi:hypothetical protein
MSAFKKNLTVALTALTLGTAALATASSAEAGPLHRHHRGWGVGAAIIGGLAVAGAYAATRPAYAEPVYDEDYGYRRCRIIERVNVYGEVVARRVCNGY